MKKTVKRTEVKEMGELSDADRSRFFGSYSFVLTGRSDLLMHRDSPTWSDELTAYRKGNAAGKKGAAGDDRNPPWTWHGYADVNPETGNLCIPAMNLTACLRDGGKKVSASRRGSLKAASATMFMVSDPAHDITLPDGRTIPSQKLAAIRNEPFAAQLEAVKDLGITLDVRRAAVGTAKHVRVRPRIPAGWSISGEVIVEDEGLTWGALYDIFTTSGRLAGLGDWRPSAPKVPGPFGRFFVAELTPGD